MYTLREFGAMIADTARMRAYEEALRLAVTPGCTVVDIGAGMGILSVLACRLGAGKVYAIEPNSAVRLGPELARANGCEDRIQFIQGLSRETSLPGPADVVVSDLRGQAALFQGSVETLIDARERLLRPGGVLIPQRDAMWAAPLSCADAHGRQMGVWREGYGGLDLSPVLACAAHDCAFLPDIKEEHLAAEPKIWADLDYRTVSDANTAGQAGWTIDREADAHGIGVWFETLLADGVSYTNATARAGLPRATVYGTLLLPWPRPVQLRRGDTVAADIRVLATGGADYVWSWRTEILDAGGGRKASFGQSSFFADPALAPAALNQSLPGARPSLGRRSQALRHALNAMDGATSLAEIAAGLKAEYPDLYPSLDRALEFVRAAARKHA